jgi:hypothetical protein
MGSTEEAGSYNTGFTTPPQCQDWSGRYPDELVSSTHVGLSEGAFVSNLTYRGVTYCISVRAGQKYVLSL